MQGTKEEECSPNSPSADTEVFLETVPGELHPKLEPHPEAHGCRRDDTMVSLPWPLSPSNLAALMPMTSPSLSIGASATV